MPWGVSARSPRRSSTRTIDGDRGRIETRTITVFHDIEWLRERHDWPGLAAVVMVKSFREISSHRPDCARSLGHREQPALGDGHGLPRRRGTRPNRSRAGQLHDHQTNGRQPDTAGPGQAFHASSQQGSRMGRRFPRKLGQGMISFTRFPCSPMSNIWWTGTAGHQAVNNGRRLRQVRACRREVQHRSRDSSPRHAKHRLEDLV